MSPRDVIGSQAKIGAHISAVALTGSVNVFLVKNFHFLSMYVVTTALLPLGSLGSYLSLYAFIAAAGDGLDLSQRHLFLLPPSPPPPPAATTLLRSVRRRAPPTSSLQPGAVGRPVDRGYDLEVGSNANQGKRIFFVGFVWVY